MCKTKQHRLAPNRLLVEHVLQVFGPNGAKYPTMLHSDFPIILDFTAHGITPILALKIFFIWSISLFFNFLKFLSKFIKIKLKLEHTVNCLLYKQPVEGTVLFIATDIAKLIPDIHLCPLWHRSSYSVRTACHFARFTPVQTSFLHTFCTVHTVHSVCSLTLL